MLCRLWRTSWNGTKESLILWCNGTCLLFCWRDTIHSWQGQVSWKSYQNHPANRLFECAIFIQDYSGLGFASTDVFYFFNVPNAQLTLLLQRECWNKHSQMGLWSNNQFTESFIQLKDNFGYWYLYHSALSHPNIWQSRDYWYVQFASCSYCVADILLL